MNRRAFLGMSAAALAASGATAAAKRQFRMKYAPHVGMFQTHAGKDYLAQLDFMAAEGFTALEDNGLMSRPVELQEKIGAALARHGMTMGVFVLEFSPWKPSLTTGDKQYRDALVATCRAAIDVARRVNAKWLTLVPGFFDRRLPLGMQTGHVIDAMRAAAEVLEPANLTMVIEPLSDSPDLFLRTSDQAYALCRAVDSPACKILFDMYHLQRNEGDVIANLDRTWSEIAYLQIGDNPGRNEPGSGEMNYRNIFRHVHEKGYRGVLGMEHGNALPGKAGERALIEAYVTCDSF